MAAHTLTVGPAVEQGAAFELARRIARGALPAGTTVDQMLTVELQALGTTWFGTWQSATLALAQQKVGAQIPATQAATLTTLGVPTDPALLAASAVTAGLV